MLYLPIHLVERIYGHFNVLLPHEKMYTIWDKSLSQSPV